MIGLNKSEKVLLSLLAVVLVGYVYYNFIIMPLTNKLGIVQNNINSYEGQLNSSKIMAANNKKMTADLENLKKNYNNNLKLMPKSNMTAQIERDINKSANDNNVSLSNLTIGKGFEYNQQTSGANGSTAASGNQNVSNAGQANNQQNTSNNAGTQKTMSVPIIININGDFNSTAAFINSLETTGRIAEITSVNISSKGSDNLTIINANMLYVQSDTSSVNNYNFNIGSYGKTDPFK